MTLDGQSSPEINLEGPPMEGPQQLEAYFVSINQTFPGPHWKHWMNGAQMSRWWAELQEAESPTQADIDAFLALLNAEPEDISVGWFILGRQFSHWARQRGFQV